MSDESAANWELEKVLIGAANILDVIRGEWGESWSEWDQSVRNGITLQLSMLNRIRSKERKNCPECNDSANEHGCSVHGPFYANMNAAAQYLERRVSHIEQWLDSTVAPFEPAAPSASADKPLGDLAQWNSTCENNHRPIQFRQIDGLACPLCALKVSK